MLDTSGGGFLHRKIGEPLLRVDHITLGHLSKLLWQVHVNQYNVVRPTGLHYIAGFVYFVVDSADFDFADFADFFDFADFTDHTLGVVLPVGGLVGAVADGVGRLFRFITLGIPFSCLPGLPGGRSEVLIPFLGSTVGVVVSAARWYPQVCLSFNSSETGGRILTKFSGHQDTIYVSAYF
jgi:hypothetical protein